MPFNYYHLALIFSTIVILAQGWEIKRLRNRELTRERLKPIRLELPPLDVAHDVEALFTIATGFNRRPIPTDVRDYTSLLNDMRKFARENPNHTFRCYDDPGTNYSPPRVSRLAWTAELEGGKEKTWTITLLNLQNSIEGPLSEEVGLNTAVERQTFLRTLVQDARNTKEHSHV